MNKTVFTTLFCSCLLACALTAGAQPQKLEDTLLHKTAQARRQQLAWHIDSRAVLDVFITCATGQYRGLREIVAQKNCKALALNKKGLLLLGEACAQTLQGPAKNFYIEIVLPYKNRKVLYKHHDFYAKNFKRKGDFALYQMLPRVPYRTQAQATQGINAPRVLSAPVTEIFKNITVPAFLGLTPQDNTFILEEFAEIFPGQTPSSQLAAWLKENMNPKDFKALQAR